MFRPIVLGAALAATALLACPPSPGPVPPTPDADATPSPQPQPEASPMPTTCDRACSNMTALGCAGIRSDCSTTLHQVEIDRLMRAPNGQPITCECLAGAASKAAVVACGVPCP